MQISIDEIIVKVWFNLSNKVASPKKYEQSSITVLYLAMGKNDVEERWGKMSRKNNPHLLLHNPCLPLAESRHFSVDILKKTSV
jgi:hypothetical protein